MNAHACGPESWGMAAYRPFIDQLAKYDRPLVEHEPVPHLRDISFSASW